jgi:hypothetical protein
LVTLADMKSNNSKDYESGYVAERPILLVAGLFALAAIPICMLLLLAYGTVRGSEFSPDDFTRRQFAYQQIPWLNWTVSGIEYTDITLELEQTLTTDRLIRRKTHSKGQKKTWHLFYDSAVPDSHACDARFLTTYLDFADWDSTTATSTPFWLKWNKKFPQSARIFWPTVADLARNEMYLTMPDVMRFALNTAEDQPKLFQDNLNKVTKQCWISAGEADFQSGEFQRAAERFCRAKLIDSSSESNKRASNQLADLIEQCRSKVDQFTDIRSRAVDSMDELNDEIADALSNKANSQKDDLTSEKIKAEADESSKP